MDVSFLFVLLSCLILWYIICNGCLTIYFLITSSLVTTYHLEQMELSVANTLGWHLHPPTCVRFIENFFPLIMSDVRDEFGVGSALELSRFLTELSVCVYQFTSSNAKPSSVAIAAILLSISHFQLPHTTEDKLRKLAASLSLELNSPEISKCGKLLSVIYACHISHDPTPLR